MSKPFDVLAEGLISENSRGDKTRLELFLAGVDGLDVTIRANLGQSTTNQKLGQRTSAEVVAPTVKDWQSEIALAMLVGCF